MATAVCSLRCDLARGRFTGEVCFFYGNGGVLSAWARRLFMDLVDQMDLMDKMGAPVFALMGYAVASHGIPRGFAVPLCGMAWGKMCRLGDYCNRRTNHTIS